MNLKKLISREIIITTISVILISITFFSVSYAIYMTVDEREIGTLTFADLYFESCSDSTCEDVGENLGNSIINVSSAPLSDTEGVALDPYSFKVSNYGNLQLITYVYVSIDTTTSYDFSKLKVAYKESASSDYTISSYGSNEIFLLYTVTLDPNDSKIIDVLMWASEEMGNDLLGQNFNAYVNAVAYYYPADEDNLHTVVPTGPNTLANAQFITQFSYTGNYQTYTAPASGWYNVELWGGSGVTSGGTGGNGSYASGNIYLEKNTALYFYVGGAGSGTVGGYNGGGSGSAKAVTGAAYLDGGGGGGATDVRLVSGVWNDSTSLNSRIMTAAGGGGGAFISANYNGGAAGGLIGSAGGGRTYSMPGGTQITGAAFGYGQNGIAASSSYSWGESGRGGGGSGYWGGNASQYGADGIAGGGGGSSFISGYAGVNAITSAASTTPTNNTKHYSGKYFINGKMLSGVNSGNGKAKITFVGVNKLPRTNTKLDGVRYIKDCINGSSVDPANHWVELQAIYNGTNIALNKTVVGTSVESSGGPYSRIVDGDITASNLAHGETYTGYQCITVDLTQTYSLDEVAVWHYYADGRSYYSNTTYVSSDNSTWTPVIANTAAESSQGKRVSVDGSNATVTPIFRVTNLVTNGSFENTGWSYGAYNTTYKKYGTYSYALTGTTGTAEVVAQTSDVLPTALDNTHIYYTRVEGYQDTKAGSGVQIYWPIAEPTFGNLTLGNASSWNLYSFRATKSTFTNGTYQLRVDYDNVNIAGVMYFDGIALIDLTATFGAGKEPTKAWCDSNLSYFDGTQNLYLSP